MIAKAEVRRQLALYEQRIRQKQQSIACELDRMRDACLTIEMKTILNQSKEYARLMAKWEVLHDVLMDIIDIRCSEMFAD